MPDFLPGYASRETTLNILLEQEADGAFLKDLFPRYSQPLPPADRAWVREAAFGVIRNRTLLDFNLDRCTPRKMGPGILRMALRLSAYQLFFMDVPAHAAVHLGVELIKGRCDERRAHFANAVLKRLASEGLQLFSGETLEAMAVNYSDPLWLINRWRRRLGAPGLLRALERNNQEAPLWIRVNPFRAEPEKLREELSRSGIETDSDAHAPLFLRLRHGGEKALHSPAFAAGKMAFQDPAAWLVAELVDWRPHQTFIDLCSAPGGKAACILERARYRGDLVDKTPIPLTCNDISFRRLRRIADATGRLGHGGLSPLVMDPARPALRHVFDIVLVDAPCSNLGVLRRRPEAKWRWNRDAKDLQRLAALQKNLLGQAASLAGIGGRIVYATCSPEDEETWEVVKAFLEAHPGWALEDAAARLPGWAVKRKCLWLYPGETEYDGFFAASLLRWKASP